MFAGHAALRPRPDMLLALFDLSCLVPAKQVRISDDIRTNTHPDGSEN
jgi:hypothetical protein